MSKNLVIVESPAKAKTIAKYLGKDFEVLASYGHVRDLVPKDGAVDVANGFTMKYELIEKNEKHVHAIVRAIKVADALYLATDPDREGEAISWHLQEILKEKGVLKNKPVRRVVFHEITKTAVQDAIANPREVANDLVNAQQARRALDYLVGFNLSPLLWRKVQPGLSAGRVQSPALRLICEREEEIKAFKPQEYWTMEARADKSGALFSSKLVELGGKKVEQFTLGDEGSASRALAQIEAAAAGVLKVAAVDKKQRRRNPAPPFTTSTLQQEANRKLGFTSSRTMRTAQQLYEGVDIAGETIGLISYMRTDSVSLAQEALAEIRRVVETQYGKKALPEEIRYYKSKSKNAQEAHEAVRPTSAMRLPVQVTPYLSPDQAKLYELIWKRTVACQMAQAVFDTVTVELKAGSDNVFRANGSVLVEPGFIAVYMQGKDEPDDEDDEKRLPPLVVGESLRLVDITPEQHFTQPPPRFTEASLVKTLEEFDIGRPSTYASIISVLQAREYVRLEGKAFVPTDVGMVVCRFLTDHFTTYVDYKFTAGLEDALDAVSRGEADWVPLLAKFWSGFKPQIDEKMELNRKDAVQDARVIGVDPVSGKRISARLGRYGAFVQIGSKEEGDEKPRYASLKASQRIDTITVEDALDLFKLPRKLGFMESGEEVEVNVGRFGPYARYGKNFVSLKKDDDVMTVELPRVIELIAQKAAALDAATLKVFGDTGIRIIKGRFGAYITDGSRRANLPKKRDWEEVSVFECEAYLAEAEAEKKPVKKGKGGKTAKAPKTAGDATATPASKAKAAAKPKAAVKKSAAKKPAAKKKPVSKA